MHTTKSKSWLLPPSVFASSTQMVALQCPSVSKPFNVIASSLSLPLPLPFPPQGLLPSRVGYSGQNHAHVQRPRWLCGIPVDRKTDRLHEVEYHGGLDSIECDRAICEESSADQQYVSSISAGVQVRNFPP